MKTFIDETQGWEVIDQAAIPDGADYRAITVFGFSSHLTPNVPFAGTKISYVKDSPKRFRSVVAIGDRTVMKPPPNGFENSAQYAMRTALDKIASHKTAPEAIKEVSRELNPRDAIGTSPRVSVAVAQVEATANGLFAQLHRSGAVKLFVFEDGVWKDALSGSVYSEAGIARLAENQARQRAELQQAIEKYGKGSEPVKKLVQVFQQRQAELDSSFKSWRCPPIGRFYTTSKLHKVLADGFHDVDAVLISTTHPELTAQRLNAQGDPKTLNRDFFKPFALQREFAVSAIAISR